LPLLGRLETAARPPEGLRQTGRDIVGPHSQSKTRTKSHFYVFLRTTVLRSQSFEDLRYVSEKQLAAAGVDDGWPRVKARVIR
jgi:hypothetical protein